MPKCKDCGFLAVWGVRDYGFSEASEAFRADGMRATHDPTNYQAKCFVQKYDLLVEVESNPDHIFNRAQAVKDAIRKERKCSEYTGWRQGFHPKEHREMLERAEERRWRLLEGLLFAIAGGSVALFAQWVAKPDIPVVNISPPTVNITTPPVNVTVQVPKPAKEPKEAKEKKP